MATKEYKHTPGLSDLIISAHRIANPKAVRDSAENASEMLSSTLASLAETLMVANMSEEVSLDRHHVMNVAWLMKELVDLQHQVMTIQSNCEYALANAASSESQ